ncbi:MAG: OmpA family protein [Microscillaceae bacterium]|nr:OmpA family protein [Microscillaceae bacterium]MDW8461695.1 OmpA family protein [Cytophagales bacterium]
MQKFFLFALLFLFSIAFQACVPKKQYVAAEAKIRESQLALTKSKEECDKLRKELTEAQAMLKVREAEIQGERSKNQSYERQIENLKSTNQNLLDRLSDLSVVSKTGAENIKKSLETLSQQSKYIKDLNASIQRKDSLNLALVMAIKRSLDNINDPDINVEVKKGVVYISIADKLLFKSGSDEILPDAERVLSKIAKVVNDHKDFDILVEGHTDNVPIKTACYNDNWDLSAKRATSIVRYLQQRHNVRPERMTAGGRGEYVPKATNATAEGRSRNRRTEIIILPKLDEFFQLLENQPKEMSNKK